MIKTSLFQKLNRTKTITAAEVHKTLGKESVELAARENVNLIHSYSTLHSLNSPAVVAYE